MAFDIFKFQRWSDGVAAGCNNMWQYTKTDETLAAITTNGYFDKLIDVTDSTVKENDIIWIQASDGQSFATFNTVVSPVQVVPFAVVLGAGSVGTANIANGAVTADKIGADAVITAKILNANVTLAKLAAGITPSHIIKFAGQATTAGGAAAEVIAVAGAAAATDRAFVQLVDEGTNDVEVVKAVVTNNTLTVTFSADPGNDCVINYQLIRAAS